MNRESAMHQCQPANARKESRRKGAREKCSVDDRTIMSAEKGCNGGKKGGKKNAGTKCACRVLVVKWDCKRSHMILSPEMFRKFMKVGRERIVAIAGRYGR